ncbi:rhodanese-like domain-containing protein [Aquimarina sp. 2-A2]|uniref:rhodanese-like domain-containing protein n=1 Tax=Aquimarina sp. 2-A2 TaxID=3382644 RepID=UPI00387EEF6A
MKKIFVIMTFLSSIFGAKAQQFDAIKILDVASFKEAVLGKNVQLVDVRTPREYEAGHIDNAINIDYFKLDKFKQSFDALDKEKPVYVYCRSGNRSQKAARKLLGMGFNTVYDLKGGYMFYK